MLIHTRPCVWLVSGYSEGSVPTLQFDFPAAIRLSLEHVTGNLRTNTADPLRIAAIKGCGLVQLPSNIVGLDIKSGRLQPVLEMYEPPKLPIYIVYIYRRHLSAKVRTFVDFIAANFQPVPYWDNWIKEKQVVT